LLNVQDENSAINIRKVSISIVIYIYVRGFDKKSKCFGMVMVHLGERSNYRDKGVVALPYQSPQKIIRSRRHGFLLLFDLIQGQSVWKPIKSWLMSDKNLSDSKTSELNFQHSSLLFFPIALWICGIPQIAWPCNYLMNMLNSRPCTYLQLIFHRLSTVIFWEICRCKWGGEHFDGSV
jgi:hypothetical protein